MIIDKELEMSLEQAITTSDASTNYIDLGAARDVGVSDGLHLAVSVDEAVTGTGAATVTFVLQADDVTGFTAPVTVVSSAAIGKAALVRGYQQFLKVPAGVQKRYLRMYYTVGTGPLLTGKFTAAIVQNVQKNIAYPNAI